MSWLSGFCATWRPRRVGLLAHVRLAGVAEREQRVRELLLGEHAEHVGLVLAHVHGAVHRDQPVLAGLELRVVAGRDRVEAERHGPVEDGGELDLLVAAQAGVRGAAGGVLGHEVLDHVLVEPVAHVPDVERDADHVGGPAGVVGVLDGAAAAGTGAVALRVAGERQVDAGDVVPGLGGASGGHGGVDAAGHGSEHAHDDQPAFLDEPKPAAAPAARARSTTGAMAAASASTSDSVLVWPSENRSELPGLLLVAPHGEQHVGGLGHAGRAGRPGRAGDAAGVEQHQQGVALAAGEGQVRVAGEPVLEAGVRVAVDAGVRHLRLDPLDQVIAQRGDPDGVVGLVLDRELDGRGRTRRSRGCRWCRSGCRAPGRRRAAAA